jgi:hypothetical protein
MTTYTPRNTQEEMIFTEYARYLNRALRPEQPVTAREVLADSQFFHGNDLDDAGYSLVSQITFEYDGCPVSLIGFFDHSDHFDRTHGIHMTLLLAAADASSHEVIYSLFPIPATYAK